MTNNIEQLLKEQAGKQRQWDETKQEVRQMKEASTTRTITEIIMTDTRDGKEVEKEYIDFEEATTGEDEMVRKIKEAVNTFIQDRHNEEVGVDVIEGKMILEIKIERNIEVK